jgi:hypothetical protein
MLKKKDISVNQRRHLILVIGYHDVILYRCAENYVTFLIMMFSNFVKEIRTLFARNSSYNNIILSVYSKRRVINLLDAEYWRKYWYCRYHEEYGSRFIHALPFNIPMFYVFNCTLKLTEFFYIILFQMMTDMAIPDKIICYLNEKCDIQFSITANSNTRLKI